MQNAIASKIKEIKVDGEKAGFFVKFVLKSHFKAAVESKECSLRECRFEV